VNDGFDETFVIKGNVCIYVINFNMDNVAQLLKGGFSKIDHGAMRDMVRGNHNWLR
jgi:hypothetical protein